jgi:hypothetical protein
MRVERWLPAAVAEIAVVLAIFAAAGAWPTPDVNEAHYLTKARHFVEPTWCAGDFFLESPAAHGVFYRLMGPLAAEASLDRAAWVGRWLGWLSLAVGFWHAVRPLLSTTAARVLAAAVFSLALRHTTAAGEWVIGGCEAKVFAWALVLGAAGEIARDRFAGAWLALAAATAVHPIVGGWGMVAVVLEWLVSGFPRSRPGLSTAVMLLAGAALAAVGIVPALRLSAGASVADRAAAAAIYVVERLPHHLLPRTFADGMVARHVLAILLLGALSRLAAAFPLPDAGGGTATARGRATGFTVAAITISLAGLTISLLEPFAPGFVHGLLRFYWFRLADGLVPLSLAVVVAAIVCGDGVKAVVPGRAAEIIRGVVVLAVVADIADQSRHWPLPGRSDLVARSDTKVLAGPWRDICLWVKDNTPADAVFLTPRGASSFTWRTGRREVVSWKNIPQDARSLLQWRARVADCFSRDGSLAAAERSTAALGIDRMRLVAGRYGADHAIVPLDTPGLTDLPWPRLHANAGYAVYRIPVDPAESR